MPPGSTLVTVLCDSGQRHVTRFWSREFIEEQGLVWPTGEEADARVELMTQGASLR